MSKKVFIEGKDPSARAYFGWQDHDAALWGLREGYKNTADNLVEIALREGSEGKIAVLDTYIFPILYLYRHSLEIGLKLIYHRFYGELPPGGHNLLILWDEVKQRVVDVFNSPGFIDDVKQYKKNFIRYSTAGIDFDEIRTLLCELQKADDNADDSKADVWRYLMDKKGKLYFAESEFVDYPNLQLIITEIYDTLDIFYHIVTEYLSGDPC